MAATGESRIVVIGASSGGVAALLYLAERLPAPFAAPICVVQHVGAQPSILPELLSARGKNKAVHAQDGQRLAAGTIHVAPPDHHMLVDGDSIRLTRGPKENYARPAIDPLLRSAASSWGTRVIGVILTGQLDDGTAGLQAVHACGGVTVVQSPATAAYPEMPRSALLHVPVDHCVDLADLASLLEKLVQQPEPSMAPPVPEQVAHEVEINRGDATPELLAAIGVPASISCPECGGSLWEMKQAKPLRYRCHTGHAYTAAILRRAQSKVAEEAVWAAVRAVQQKQMLLQRLAEVAAAGGDLAQADACRAQAQALDPGIGHLRGLAQLPLREGDAAQPLGLTYGQAEAE